VSVSPLVKTLLFLALAAVAVLGYLFLLNVLNGKLGAFSTAVPAILLALAALLLNSRFLRSEGSSPAAIGLEISPFRVAQAVLGFLAGVVIVGVWMLALRGVMSAEWQEVPLRFAAAIGAFTFIVANNLAEELVYRGFLFVLLARSYGTAAAVIATSVLFTLLHFQAGVPLPNVVAGVLTSAFLYAAVFGRWRSVPLVLGVHVGMNFMQELGGLRHGGLTAVAPVYAHAASARESTVMLFIVGIINVALAIVVWRSALNRTIQE